MSLQSISVVKTATSIQPVRLKCTVFGLLCFSTMQYQRVEGSQPSETHLLPLAPDTRKGGAGPRTATLSSVPDRRYGFNHGDLRKPMNPVERVP